MNMLRLICGMFLALALTTPGLAQETAPLPPLGEGIVRVRLDTSLGTLILDLNQAKAPITVANYLRYVDQGRFDGASFYRASKVPNDDTQGLIQGGVQNDPKRVLRPIAHEPTSRTGLTHTHGAISMGRHAPGTATSDFFIILGDATYLDADPTQPGDNLGFAAFGHVVQGMDVAAKILTAPTSPTAGVGVMKGEMLARPVTILRARRVSAASTATP